MRSTGAPTLGDDLKAMIAQDGPLTVERFMALALGHPTRGYYATRDPFGAAGDFVTAPEVSQMFGELLGAWAATAWAAMGAPAPLRLVELGPGRGTLMADALRATRRVPGFYQAVDLHLVETSPVLRHAQSATLGRSGRAPTWHASLADVPPGPAVVIANEFFDALPVRQFVRAGGAWRERLVGCRADSLVFGVAGEPEAGLTFEAPEGAMLEIGATAREVAAALGARLAHDGGAAVVIDYGYAGPQVGDTLQAVKGHRFVDPLAEPGEADLTAHVDFSALARAARRAGAGILGPVTQGDFLRELGIEARAETLLRGATPAQAETIAAALARLVGQGTPERPGMGEAFKVLGLAAPGLPALPGFTPAIPEASWRRCI